MQRGRQDIYRRVPFEGDYYTRRRFNDVALELIRKMAAHGKTQRNIAKTLRIDIKTFERHLKNDAEARVAYDTGKKEQIQNVEKSLYQLATGYSHKDTQFFMYKGTIITKTYIKHYPPNAFAALKILMTKDRENWAQIHQSQFNAEINVKHTLDLTDFTNEELGTIEKLGLQKMITENVKQN